ncbi:ectonucleoside triphosphate diphosphohydrolase 3 [Dasypus novemcinctus]|uniref:ectonucleoside triphosphate diphosphohydrolase 3 n=1 Tax=Dasypus novemcinctus TaxID=9361 RepID=UPI00265E13A3|nr:ectonucleoside triphosphate diphosphohydrolase 3 [Dasypus novemcinctus]
MIAALRRPPRARAGLQAPCRAPTVAAWAGLLVSVAVLAALSLVQTLRKDILPPGLRYGVVLDAGSSRTTLYVYQWPAEKENNTGVVSQSLRCGVRGSGISSYGNNPQDVPRALEDCVQRAREHVPAQLHAATRVHLGATAGMRLLRLQNETAANEVLASIRDYFKSQPFDFRGAQILSGQEEGVYGWITANYLLGNFLEKNLWNMWVHPHGVETTGALDLGGASTQIAFAAEGLRPNGSDAVQVSLYGYAYTLYTHSFQCYGRNEAEKRLLARLLQSSPTKTNLTNPCYPRNYSTAFPAGRIFDSLCTAPLRPAGHRPGDIISFEGTGDPLQCREQVASLFNFEACRDRDACSFDGVYQPKVKGPFVAFAGFYYTASALNLSGSFSLDTFNASTWHFCSQDWSQLPLLLPRFDEEYARSYCFSAHYVYHLLVNGYKFTEETWPQIHFKKEVGDSSVAWPLGYMLSLTNQIPAGRPRLRAPLRAPALAGLLCLFAGAAALSLAVLVHAGAASRRARRARRALDPALDSE